MAAGSTEELIDYAEYMCPEDWEPSFFIYEPELQQFTPIEDLFI